MGRGRLFCLLVALAMCANANLDANEFWQFDANAATQQAIKKDHLLVIVQFDQDFLTSPLNSTALQNYQHHAVTQEVAEWAHEHAVVVAENVGKPFNVRVADRRIQKNTAAKTRAASEVDSADSGPIQPSIGNCITWICQPCGTVLFCLAGYPDSDQLLSKLQWAESVRRSTSGNVQQLVVSQKRHVEPEDYKFFESHLGAPPKKRGKVVRSKWIDQNVRTLVAVRKKRIEQRFGANWSRQKLEKFNRSLANFSAFESQFQHCLFAELPDLKIDEIQRPFWREVALTRIWSANKSELADWARMNKDLQKPMLMRIKGERFTASDWPPRKPDILPDLLDKFAVREVTLDDAAVVCLLINGGSIDYKNTTAPTFFISTTAGDNSCTLTNRNTNSDLAEALLPIFEQEEYRK